MIESSGRRRDMSNNLKMTMCAVGAAALLFSVQAQAQTLTLEQVIKEVCTNSDSVKMMKETVIKADQMVRENWANALPYVSLTGAYVHDYGSPFSSSSGGGGSSSSRPMAKTAARHRLRYTSTIRSHRKGVKLL